MAVFFFNPEFRTPVFYPDIFSEKPFLFRAKLEASPEGKSQNIPATSIKNLFHDFNYVQSIIHFAERDVFLFGNSGKTSVLVSISGHD